MFVGKGGGSTVVLLLHFGLEVCWLRYWISKSDQSGGTLAQLIRRQYVLTNWRLPVTISYCQISIWSSLGLDIGFEKASLRSNAKSSVAD